MAVNGKTRPGDVQSVRRALQLLEAVGDAGDMGVTELAKRLGLAVSTVHNILRTLVHRGYLINSAGRYRLGPAVTVLTSQWDPVQSLASVVRPKLGQVTDRCGQAALATVLVGSEACLIAFTSGTGPVTASSPGWTRANPLSLATGCVLVAMTRHQEWARFIEASAAIEPERSVEVWSEQLSAIADSGVCVKQDGDANATVAVAVPVWTTGGSVICALGCSMPGYFVSEQLLADTLDALWDAASELSRELGCEPVPLAKPPSPPRMSLGR